jgi:hypothetical protein
LLEPPADIGYIAHRLLAGKAGLRLLLPACNDVFVATARDMHPSPQRKEISLGLPCRRNREV